jgi:glycosyltransferase involved in cell wall biosynthesis
VYWDTAGKKTPFEPTPEPGIHYYRRSDFCKNDLIEVIKGLVPVCIYVSGRMDDLYLSIARHFKNRIPVISGCDNQWRGKMRDYISAVLGKLLYRRYFDYFWVPGERQLEFARRVGYTRQNVIRYLYSADIERYADSYEFRRKQNPRYPHSFVFVGRFAPEKGVEMLVEAFKVAKAEFNSDWSLTIVGSGDLNCEIQDRDDIFVKGFMSPDELVHNCSKWGVFCLPSLSEPWGVVVHEFAAAGLPVICSDCVGSADTFVIRNYNGLIFSTGDRDSMKHALLSIMHKTDEELWLMGLRSRDLAQCITPERSAYSLMSVVTQ